MPDLGVRSPVDLVLPAALLVVWAVWLIRERHVPRLFFAPAAAVAVLCFPIGAWAFARQPAVEDCRPLAACVDYSPVAWWVNGGCGLLTVAALALLSGLIRLVRLVRLVGLIGDGARPDRSPRTVPDDLHEASPPREGTFRNRRHSPGRHG